MDEPVEERKDDDAEQGPPESRDFKTGHHERHRPKEQSIEYESEKPERDECNRECEDGEYRPYNHRDDRPYERNEQRRRPISDLKPRHERDGEIHRSDCTEIFQ